MEFSREQKDFLQRFIKCDTKIKYYDSASPFFLPNALFMAADIFRLEVNYNDETSRSGRKLEVFYEKCNSKYKGIYSIFDWVYFFEYLRDNNYVQTITLKGKQDNDNFGYAWTDDDLRISLGTYRHRNLDNIDSEDIDNIEIDGLKNWWCQCIYPRQKLIELVLRNFKTPEQIRFNRQIRITILALLASTALGIFGFCENRVVETCPEQQNELMDAVKSALIDTTYVRISKPIPKEANLEKG